MNISVFLGAPGSGKGTQAKKLAQSYGYVHFSTGDMLRAAIQAGSEVGLQAKGFIDRGDLVPDGVMISIIESALAGLSKDARVLLDGFPRTVPQAQALDSKNHTAVTRALFFKIPEPILITRLTGRRTCRKCGESFHVIFLPPKTQGICDRCGGELFQRTDDMEEVVVRRLEVFKGQNERLMDYFRNRRCLFEVDADRPVDEVQGSLLRMLS